MMDYRHMTAPCGLDCFNCPVYLAGGNEKLREAVAKHMNLPYEQAVCRGCRGEKGAPAAEGFTGKCDVYKCTEKKGISFCCDCSDFPCDHLHPYADQAAVLPHNTKVFNLCLIKKMGLEAWAQTRAKSVRDTYFKGKFKL
jgi:hypothetical protein